MHVVGACIIPNPYGVPGTQIDDWVELATPEGYGVYKAQNGSEWDIYLRVSGSHFALFTKDGTAPGDWDASNRTNRTFLKNHQEVYGGRAATSLDPDFDGISTIEENKCGLNPNSNDTDGAPE